MAVFYADLAVAKIKPAKKKKKCGLVITEVVIQLQYQCSVLPLELTSQLRAAIVWIRNKYSQLSRKQK